MKTFGPAISAATYDPISEHAAELLERRRFEEWSDADQAGLDAWLAESTLHRVAYLRLEGAAAYAEHLTAAHAFKVEQKPSEPAPRGKGKLPYLYFVYPLLAVAAIALFAVFGIPFVTSLLQPPDRNFSTDVGGRTLVKFADGTEIELNTDTAMRFRMTTAERTVWLDKGEAWFRVAHNAANPFTVIAGKHRVTDLGTEFFIRRGAGRVEVALVNGRAMLNTKGTPTTMLAPGDDAVATPVSVSVARKTARELADELAWRRGMLVFRKAKLADVVREFNRYNQTKLVIADPSIAGEPFTADLRTDDFEDFLNLAQRVLNLRVDYEGNVVLISRHAQRGTKSVVRAKRGG